MGHPGAVVGVTQVWKEPITPLISLSNPLCDELVMPHGNCDLQTCGPGPLGLRALPEERGGRGTAPLHPFHLERELRVGRLYLPSGC